MKLEISKDLFDEYAWKARVLPALICSAPVVLVANIIGYFDVAILLASILSGLGVIFLVAQVVRTLGRRKEKWLCEQWNGMPTTQLLRLSTSRGGGVRDTRRGKLEALTGITLPSRREEAVNPAEADAMYVAATRSLISKVRQRKQDFPRVHEENINYGFRRNLLALKPIALFALITLVILACGLSYLGHDILQVCLVLLVTLLFTIIWGVVTPGWVRDAADAYAERLFEALGELA